MNHLKHHAGRSLAAGLLALAAGCEVASPPPSAPPSPGASADTPIPNPTRPTAGMTGAPGPFEALPLLPATPPALPLVTARGAGYADPQGRPVVPRGCNLGNWLLLEMWMLDLPGVRDQREFEEILTARFGEARRDELMDLYRAGYVTARDFDVIRSFGFNCVRLPFEYGLLEDDRATMRLRPGAFRWLDRAVALARDAGLHVVLDLHGAPGRQSVDHTTGRAGRNELWTDPAAQDRTAWLWREIARRYRDEDAVLGYDLLNEPFGDYRTPAHLPALVALMDRLVREVRAVDDRHVIFIAGSREGLDHYGQPADRGWTNVAFTEHFYPGLFGSPATVESHARFLGQTIPAKAARMARLGVPFYVGEFNVVHRRLGGPALMRRYMDTYASNGWAATMWSYKLLRRDGGAGGDFWGMAANRDPLPPFDPRTSSFEDLRAFFASLATMPLAVNEDLRRQLTADRPDPVELPAYPLLRDAPRDEPVPGWRASDIGGARPGGQRRLGPDAVEVYGGGRDLWGTADQFRLLAREVRGDALLSARLDRLDDADVHAKAGVMLRASARADAAHVYLHAFPDGRVMLAWRPRDGAAMTERELAQPGFPVHLRIGRRDGLLQAAWSRDGRTWNETEMPDDVALPRDLLAGLAVLAHADNEFLTTAAFRQVAVGPAPRPAP